LPLREEVRRTALTLLKPDKIDSSVKSHKWQAPAELAGDKYKTISRRGRRLKACGY